MSSTPKKKSCWKDFPEQQAKPAGPNRLSDDEQRFVLLC